MISTGRIVLSRFFFNDKNENHTRFQCASFIVLFVVLFRFDRRRSPYFSFCPLECVCVCACVGRIYIHINICKEKPQQRRSKYLAARQQIGNCDCCISKAHFFFISLCIAITVCVCVSVSPGISWLSLNNCKLNLF